MGTQNPFGDLAPDDSPDRHALSTSARIIGASCGAFVFCFVAILISLPFNKGVNDQQMEAYFWIASLACGAIGGFAFPRLGHFLTCAFILLINIMLSLAIGRNFGEQLALFGIFTFTEMLFVMSRRILKNQNS